MDSLRSALTAVLAGLSDPTIRRRDTVKDVRRQLDLVADAVLPQEHMLPDGGCRWADRLVCE